MKELYEVVWPLGKSVYKSVPLAPRVPDLRGKTIGWLYDGLFRGEEIFSLVENLIRDQFPGVKFVDHTKFGNIHSHEEAKVISALPDLLHKYKCEAVISGIGG